MTSHHVSVNQLATSSLMDMATSEALKSLSSESNNAGTSVPNGSCEPTSIGNVKDNGGTSEELLVMVTAVRENLTRRRDSENDVWRTLEIPRRLAFEWYNDLLKGGSVNFAALLNKSVKSHSLNLNEKDVALNDRFKRKLSKQFGSNYISRKGGERKRYLDQHFYFDVKMFESGVSQGSSLVTQVENLQGTVERLESEVATKNTEVKNLKESLDNCKELLKKSATTVNEGKLYDEVGERQKRRKVLY